MLTRDTLVSQTTILALLIARRFHDRFASPEDADQEALLGLLWASRSYDPDRGPFERYAATVIRRHLVDAVSDQAHAIRIPRTSNRRSPIAERPKALAVDPDYIGVLDDPYDDAPELIRAALEHLDCLPREIISRFHGIGRDFESLADIANSLNLTRVHTKRILDRAMIQLQDHLRFRGLSLDQII
jgi:RNA polymerase sigma factor (sigma-70 family)